MNSIANKTVLVTGGTGLVGSHLVQALLAKGARVVVTYRDLDPWSYFVTEGLDKKVVMAACDITNQKRVLEVMSKYEVDIIFHLAAQALVPQAFLNPVQTFDANIMGTVHVLDAARVLGNIEAIVVASSDKAYGKCAGEYVESDALRGDHPYDTSKSATDLIAQTYHVTYGLPIAITRFGNIYGEGDLNMNRLIPGLMLALMKNEVFEIRSDGTYTRDFVYVKDVVEGYMQMAENIEKTRGEAFNITSDEHLSVLDAVHAIEEALDKKVDLKILNTAQNEIPHQKLNDKKLRNLLGWGPHYRIHDVVPGIFDWYQSIFAKVKNQ